MSVTGFVSKVIEDHPDLVGHEDAIEQATWSTPEGVRAYLDPTADDTTRRARMAALARQRITGKPPEPEKPVDRTRPVWDQEEDRVMVGGAHHGHDATATTEERPYSATQAHREIKERRRQAYRRMRGFTG